LSKFQSAPGTRVLGEVPELTGEDRKPREQAGIARIAEAMKNRPTQ